MEPELYRFGGEVNYFNLDSPAVVSNDTAYEYWANNPKLEEQYSNPDYISVHENPASNDFDLNYGYPAENVDSASSEPTIQPIQFEIRDIGNLS